MSLKFQYPLLEGSTAKDYFLQTLPEINKKMRELNIASHFDGTKSFITESAFNALKPNALDHYQRYYSIAREQEAKSFLTMIENDHMANKFQFLDHQLSQFPAGPGPFTDLQIQQSRELIFINSDSTLALLKHLNPNIQFRVPVAQRLVDLRAACNAAPNNIVTPFRTTCSNNVIQFSDAQRTQAQNTLSLNVITRRNVMKKETDRLALLSFPVIDATLTPDQQVTAIKAAIPASLLTTAQDQWAKSELAFASNKKTNDEINAQVLNFVSAAFPSLDKFPHANTLRSQSKFPEIIPTLSRFYSGLAGTDTSSFQNHLDSIVPLETVSLSVSLASFENALGALQLITTTNSAPTTLPANISLTDLSIDCLHMTDAEWILKYPTLRRYYSQEQVFLHLYNKFKGLPVGRLLVDYFINHPSPDAIARTSKAIIELMTRTEEAIGLNPSSTKKSQGPPLSANSVVSVNAAVSSQPAAAAFRGNTNPGQFNSHVPKGGQSFKSMINSTQPGCHVHNKSQTHSTSECTLVQSKLVSASQFQPGVLVLTETGLPASSSKRKQTSDANPSASKSGGGGRGQGNGRGNGNNGSGRGNGGGRGNGAAGRGNGAAGRGNNSAGRGNGGGRGNGNGNGKSGGKTVHANSAAVSCSICLAAQAQLGTIAVPDADTLHAESACSRKEDAFASKLANAVVTGIQRAQKGP